METESSVTHALPLPASRRATQPRSVSSTGNTWTLEQEQSALLPYLVVLVIAVVVFLFTRARSYEERTATGT